MEITLKNVKVFDELSQETMAYFAEVYIDGVKTFQARNEGHGGSDSFDPHEPFKANRAKIAEAEQYALTLYPTSVSAWGPSEFMDEFELSPSSALEVLIHKLVDEEMQRRQMLAWQRKETLFRLPGMDEGVYKVVRYPSNNGVHPEVRKHILKEYPDAEIIESVRR